MTPNTRGGVGDPGVIRVRLGHEHVWHGVGTQDVGFERDEPTPPANVISMNHWPTIRCIVRACDCGDWYLQPLIAEDILGPGRIRPYPKGMKRR